jgi:hypothetical protein
VSSMNPSVPTTPNEGESALVAQSHSKLNSKLISTAKPPLHQGASRHAQPHGTNSKNYPRQKLRKNQRTNHQKCPEEDTRSAHLYLPAKTSKEAAQYLASNFGRECFQTIQRNPKRGFWSIQLTTTWKNFTLHANINGAINTPTACLIPADDPFNTVSPLYALKLIISGMDQPHARTLLSICGRKESEMTAHTMYVDTQPVHLAGICHVTVLCPEKSQTAVVIELNSLEACDSWFKHGLFCEDTDSIFFPTPYIGFKDVAAKKGNSRPDLPKVTMNRQKAQIPRILELLAANFSAEIAQSLCETIHMKFCTAKAHPKPKAKNEQKGANNRNTGSTTLSGSGTTLPDEKTFNTANLSFSAEGSTIPAQMSNLAGKIFDAADRTALIAEKSDTTAKLPSVADHSVITAKKSKPAAKKKQSWIPVDKRETAPPVSPIMGISQIMALKESGNELFKSSHYEAARAKYKEALNLSAKFDHACDEKNFWNSPPWKRLVIQISPPQIFDSRITNKHCFIVKLFCQETPAMSR